MTEAPQNCQKTTDALRHAFRAVDGLDWRHLESFIPDSGHGRFWKAVFSEVRTSLAAPPASGDVRAAVIEPTDDHGHTGEFTATEFNERAWDHEKAAKNGLSAGPNVSYVRTFQACAVALRYAAKHMFSQSPATDAAGGSNG